MGKRWPIQWHMTEGSPNESCVAGNPPAERDAWQKAAARRTHRTAEAAQVVIDAIKPAEMDPGHEALDDLVK